MTLLELLVKELPKLGGWPGDRTVASNGINGTVVFHSKGRAPFVMAGLNFSGTGCVSFEEYEAALAASKPSEWNGEGLPEKGDLCIYRDKDEGPIETIVIASCDDGGDVVIWHKPIRGRDYSVDSLCLFEAAVNEEDNKRIRVAQAMCDLLGNGIIVDEKEGYGKAWLDAYDAIAAGKIPGIRLTDDAGN